MPNIGISSTPTKSSAFLTHSTSTTSLRGPSAADPSQPAQPTRAPPPPEIESTLSRLTAHRNVQGVLILSREGALIQSTGQAFEGDKGRAYAGSVRRMVDAVREAVGEADEGDDVKFMRIRTKRHELLITPDERYILVVLQDPA